MKLIVGALLAVTGGTFEVDVTGYEALMIHLLSLGGRGAAPEVPGLHFLVDRGPIVVRAFWPGAPRLKVGAPRPVAGRGARAAPRTGRRPST